MKGFGEQFGTRYAQGMVKSTATFLAGAALSEDPRPLPPLDVDCPGRSPKFWPRVGRSLERVVWEASAGNCGKGRVDVSRIAGSFASGFVSLAWQPSTAFTGTGTAFAGYVGNSIFTEFQGDIYRILGKVFTSGKPKAAAH
jgi:hypothetical protein